MDSRDDIYVKQMKITPEKLAMAIQRAEEKAIQRAEKNARTRTKWEDKKPMPEDEQITELLDKLQDIECERNRARHDQLVAEAKIKELETKLAAYRESQKEVKK